MIEDKNLELIQQQLIELQSQLSFQEDTIQSLNNVVTRQQQQIENLHELCTSQKSELDALATEVGSSPQEDRPPHY